MPISISERTRFAGKANLSWLNDLGHFTNPTAGESPFKKSAPRSNFRRTLRPLSNLCCCNRLQPLFKIHRAAGQTASFVHYHLWEAVVKSGIGRQFITRALWLMVAFLLVFAPPARAATHPVPLDKNTDAAKCLECHNSDDNREFGGTGPNGPHGSKWTHILERRYEFSQAMAPGQLITTLYPNPDLSVNGPYALCGKCHNLSNIMQNTSFKKHSSHVIAGFSCSACHTAHGVGASSGNTSGERLVNFDVNVVGSNGGYPISYNRGNSTCTLTCHEAVHNADGTVKIAVASLKTK